jgi:hypothetical protein
MPNFTGMVAKPFFTIGLALLKATISARQRARSA